MKFSGSTPSSRARCCSRAAPAWTRAGPRPVPEIRPGLLQGYLAREALPNSLALLPPPPDKGSAAFALDEEIARKSSALRGTPRWAMATSDADLHLPERGRCFLLCGERSDRGRVHAAPVPAPAPHAHRRGPLHLRRQGPLPPHASVRREQRASLHAGRANRSWKRMARIHPGTPPLAGHGPSCSPRSPRIEPMESSRAASPMERAETSATCTGTAT